MLMGSVVESYVVVDVVWMENFIDVRVQCEEFCS